jgi:hypothetical protein
MNKQLAQLISDYQAAVGVAILLMTETGIEIPSSGRDWAVLDIPAHGELNGGIKYYKHGQGCAVYLPEGEVDFDFGQQGQTDGFDEWRLWKFCEQRPNIYAFETHQALVDCVQHALKEKKLVAPLHDLYYVVDSVKLLDEEAVRILVAGCDLPHRSRDSVHALSAQCFESANLMFEHYQAMIRLWEKQQKFGRGNGVKFRVYLLSWLGYLHETADGFRKLRMRLLLQNKRPASFLELIVQCDEIGTLDKRYGDDLRVLRNNIFHLRVDDKAINQFFSDDGERVEWAKQLHAAFNSFFSSYRILTEVHYVLSRRLGESQMRKDGVERGKRRAEAKAKRQAAHAPQSASAQPL